MKVAGRAGMLAVDDGGTGEPACLLLHSLGGRAGFWHAILRELRRGRRAVAFDFRGHGDSTAATLAESTLDDFADDALRVADTLGLSTFHLVGHSFGATVALAVAARAPTRVVSLTLVDPAGAFDGVPASALEDFLAQVLGDGSAAFLEEAYQANLDRATPGTREQVLASLAATDQATLGGGYTALFASDPRAMLRRYPGPLRLIVDQANDSPMSLHAQVPDLDVVPVEGTSHWIMLDQPDAFARALMEFLANAGEQPQ